MFTRSRSRSTGTGISSTAGLGARSAVVGLSLVSATAVVLSFAPLANAAPASGTDLVKGECPALFGLGVQGTGQSAPDAAPTTDTGMLSQVFMPMIAKAVDGDKELAGRAYVPYEAGFGGAVLGGNVPYSQSVEGGLQNLRDMASEVAAACPDTKFTLAGYSQGAHVVSLFAEEVGKGSGVIAADKVVGVATFGDPTRAAGAPLFPGSPGQTSPKPAPGTDGAEVSKVSALDQVPPAGGGIGPVADVAENYGSLTGRVASFCQSGDLACDAPSDSPILRVVTNIAGQSELSSGDPIRSLTSVGDALAMTSIKTAVTVVNEDISGTTLANLSIAPKKSLSERLAVASDPRTPLPSTDDAIKAIMKVGTIGFNAVKTVAKEVLTPANIVELATVGLANPAGAVALLGTKLVGAATKLIPPATTSRLTTQAFAAVKDNVSDNKDLLNLATLTKYSSTVAAHGGYGSVPATATGTSATAFVTDWFVALAKDLADRAGGSPSSTTKATSTAVATRPSSSSSATTTTSPRPNSTSTSITSTTAVATPTAAAN
ncbi:MULTISPECIES: cutinase family protein [Rhodococcus]|jgi:hypothetical protein|uniref:cutinase family protein n=2 Tax=Nocardiaceae TaxID=85025 RepID=UPI0002DEF240|nr:MULTISPECIES: cutinase family protein [Rhodococcus]MDJ0016515.1 cutinase family protein [Rhodococcus erythropolis]QTS03580.1 cutinase family protein [Rhodococcus qingshengii]